MPLRTATEFVDKLVRARVAARRVTRILGVEPDHDDTSVRQPGDRLVGAGTGTRTPGDRLWARGCRAAPSSARSAGAATAARVPPAPTRAVRGP